MDEQRTKEIGVKVLGQRFRTYGLTRADGKKQNTYKCWPLYYLSRDANANDIKGDAVNGTWLVAKPDYILVIANTHLISADGNKYRADLNAGEAVKHEARCHTNLIPEKKIVKVFVVHYICIIII